MKIVFFGTSEIGVPILESLIDNHEVLAVVTSPDKPVGRKQELTPSPIAEVAKQHKIQVLKPKKVRDNPDFLSELAEIVDSRYIDIFVVVSYGKILPQELLDLPPLKTINVHFSMLPKYRGAAPVQFALLNGETKTGTSIFILDAEVDHGFILATKEVDIDPNDTNITLQAKLADISADLLIETLPKYQSGEITPQEQDHSQATFTKIIKKEDGLVDWSKPASEIYNQFRAYQPWPGIYTTWQGKNLKIIDCKLSEDETQLELITIQLEGKNPTSLKDFKNGYPDFDMSQLK